MKHRFILALVSIFLGWTFVGCSDDLFLDNSATTLELDESDIVDVSVAVSINNFQVSTEGSTRTEEPSEDTEIMSDFEKQVDNICVFQYDASGNLLIKPRYYLASESETDGTWQVVLKPNVASKIYVVTNVADGANWASDYTNFATEDELLASNLPAPYSIYDLSDADAVEGHIPAKGYTEGTVTPGNTIIVPVEHMYAKVKVRIILDRVIDEYRPSINYVVFQNSPYYCRVGTLFDGTDATSQDDKYSSALYWGEYSLGTNGEGNNVDDPNNGPLAEAGEATYDYVIYIPENIQGEVGEETAETKDTQGDKLAHASKVVMNLKYYTINDVESSKNYEVYPGGNVTNNFNIRRNQVYRVTMKIGYPIEPDPVPSANCLVGHPGTTISFEPYYRVETGGGYNFSDYISPNSEEGSGKQIKGIKILWQTEDCIGDNSKGDLVYFDASEPQDLHDKIYVKTNAPGNAVIAAYDDDPDSNPNAEIIWSWHIWVTEEDPTNVGNAITYYTYDWDSTGIYGYDTGHSRVPGYGCMPCNLGALASEPKSTSGENAVITYGMLYQWGRKDPFPALKGAASGKYGSSYKYTEYGAYNQNTTEWLWDNDYKRITGMTDDTNTDSLFHSVTAKEILEKQYDIQFSIQNPTVFMCGTDSAARRSSDYVAGQNTSASYTAGRKHYPDALGGDWKVTHDERLWGADQINSGTKCYNVGEDRDKDTAHLYDDYGQKSIFDPCPYGWRVSPPDQWLGFTIDGLNPATDNYQTNINYDGSAYGYGLYIYIQSWRSGLKSYFPTQGTRAPDGSGGRPIRCGNYHNATADAGTIMQRVNILHIHNGGDFNVFELGIVAYYVKSVAGPVRCVRDAK